MRETEQGVNGRVADDESATQKAVLCQRPVNGATDLKLSLPSTSSSMDSSVPTIGGKLSPACPCPSGRNFVSINVNISPTPIASGPSQSVATSPTSLPPLSVPSIETGVKSRLIEVGDSRSKSIVVRTPPPSMKKISLVNTALTIGKSIGVGVGVGSSPKRAHSHTSLFGDADSDKNDNADEQQAANSSTKLGVKRHTKQPSASAVSSDRCSFNNEAPFERQSIDLGSCATSNGAGNGSSSAVAVTMATSSDADHPDTTAAPPASDASASQQPPSSSNSSTNQGATEGRKSEKSEKTDNSVFRSSGIVLKSAWRSLMAKSYVQRDAEFRKQFGDWLDPTDRYIVEYHCAYLMDKVLLQQGKMYITQRMVFFVSRVFRTTKLRMPFAVISAVKKEKTIKLIENALRVSMSDGRSFFFASFATRNETFNVLTQLHQAAQDKAKFGNVEFWAMIQSLYGSDVGRNGSIPPLSPAVSIVDSPDDQDFLILEHSSRASQAAPVDSAAVAVDSDELLVDDSDHERADGDSSSDDVEDDADDAPTVPARSLSYVSLTEPSAATCSGHTSLESVGLQNSYNLPIETVYDGLLNVESRIYRDVSEGQKSKMASVEEWQRVEVTDADRDRLPTRPELIDSVELVKLQRRLCYNTSLVIVFTATVTNEEQQTVLVKRSVTDPSRIYSALISSRVDSSGVPMAKNAYFLRQFCLHRVAGDAKRSRLTASQQIVFKSNFQKQTLTTQLNSRTGAYYKQLDELLVREAEEVSKRYAIAAASVAAAAAAAAVTVQRPLSSATANSASTPVANVGQSRSNVGSHRAAVSKAPASDVSAILTTPLLMASPNAGASVSAVRTSNDRLVATDQSQPASFTRGGPVRVIQHELLLILLCFLGFLVWSQLTLNARLENIDQLLRQLLLSLGDAERQRAHSCSAFAQSQSQPQTQTQPHSQSVLPELPAGDQS